MNWLKTMRAGGVMVYGALALVAGLVPPRQSRARPIQGEAPTPTERASISGTVVNESDSGIEGVRVEVLIPGVDYGEIWTDKDGVFSWTTDFPEAQRLRSVVIEIEPFGDTYSPQVAEVVEGTSGMVVRKLSSVEPLTARFSVADRNGIDVPRGLVLVYPAMSMDSGEAFDVSIGKCDITYKFRSDTVLFVVAPGFRTRRFMAAHEIASQGQNIDVVLEPGFYWEFVVRDSATGGPLSDALVLIGERVVGVSGPRGEIAIEWDNWPVRVTFRKRGYREFGWEVGSEWTEFSRSDWRDDMGTTPILMVPMAD